MLLPFLPPSCGVEREGRKKKSRFPFLSSKIWLFLIAQGSHPVSRREYLQDHHSPGPTQARNSKSPATSENQPGWGPRHLCRFKFSCQNASLSSPILTTPMCPPLKPFNLLSGRIPCLALLPQPLAVTALVPRNFNSLPSHLARLGAVNSL